MHDNFPFVSIVTPVYNGSKYLEELIISVLDQSYTHYEHIIIDDGSNDEGKTVSILRRYSHLRWWSRENKGAYETINEGILSAKGDLVTVICSDDMYASKNSLALAVKAFMENDRVDAVYGGTESVDVHGAALYDQPPSGPISLFNYYTVVSHCSLFVRRSFIVQNNILFNVTFPYAADHVWIFDLIRSNCRFKRIKPVVAMHRRHVDQRSNDVNPARKEERERVIKKVGKGNVFLRVVLRNYVRFYRYSNILMRKGPFVLCDVIVKRFVG